MKPNENFPNGRPEISRRTLVIVASVIVVSMALVFVVGFWIRHERITQREKMAKDIRDRPLVVRVVQAKATQKSFELTLPADVRAYAATALYARTNGFLASWKVDINDRVKKGDLMAVISAPDTDADLEQAVANQNQQQVNYQLAAATDERYRALIPTQGVTQQQLDQFRTNMEQAKASAVSTTAAVDRLKALVGFERITAPFDGVVTARTYDVGALISASNIGPGQELFDIAEDDMLRVFVNVPQAYALMVRFDEPVELVLERNYPGHRFTGVIKRSAGTLDTVTRTLRTELDFKNDDPAFRIFPGMFGEAVFTLKREQPVLTIPTSALLFEADGKQVALVGPDNKVHFQKITPGIDFGTEIEVISGLKGGERVISDPGEQLAEGLVVSPVADAQAGAPADRAAPTAPARPPGQ
jgi:membrane fusion protein, multidrug efflux system